MLFVNLKLHNKLIQGIKTRVNGMEILAVTFRVRDWRPLKRKMSVDRFEKLRVPKMFVFVHPI